MLHTKYNLSGVKFLKQMYEQKYNLVNFSAETKKNAIRYVRCKIRNRQN